MQGSVLIPMEESVISKQSLLVLLGEIQKILLDLDYTYPHLISKLKSLDPFLNLKVETRLHSKEGKEALLDFKDDLEIYLSHLDRLLLVDQDFVAALQLALDGIHPQDALFQECLRQKNLLSRDMQLRREAGRILEDLDSVLDRVAIQEQITPAQRKKLEDSVFKLQTLANERP